ncbi:MAG TPA: sulfotransferase [Hyphomicrobiales bacterium]|nr:sulfotransferase [Hyphomicrobiales bacterium]
MDAKVTAKPPLSVPYWTDLLSTLQARHPSLWIALGNLESRFLAERLANIRIEKPIYIAGLARSGSTILLELLSRHPHLASHRYRDFPPVFTPWSWNWFVDRAGNAQQTPVERAHGDGIAVTPQSPEAFEEVLWMAFFPHLHDPAVNAALDAQTSNPAFERFYDEHLRKLLLLRGARRYLSKANYNVTRLPYLLKLFPDARFILPVRDPLWHIASLMRQHAYFCREHTRDTRLLRHMNHSGHFEFGLGRQPINPGNPALLQTIRAYWARGEEVQGWSLYWQAIHGHLATLLETDAALRQACLVVDFDRLCHDPAGETAELAAHCDLPTDVFDLPATASTMIRAPSYYEPTFSQAQRDFITTTTGPVLERLAALRSSQEERRSQGERRKMAIP